MSEWFDFAIEHLPYVLQGIPTTLGLWASAMVIGAALGLVLAWARIYGSRPIYLAATIYVEIFRGTPMLVQMLFIYLGLPEIGIVFDPLTAAIIAIGLNTAAYQAEYFRGAVRSVPIGQMAAARALGMGQFQGFKNIILPQALRRVIPQWSNEAILELKYTSIAYAIGVTEITARAEKIGYETFQFFEVFLLIAAIYVVMTSVVAQVLLFVEKRVSVPGL
ncbi:MULTISPECIES: amino acid ABC transporter permease [Thalassospira]|jgi:polar amino acid transport system permease protein|uniref:amino acid ABC transporter permease n=1 Tax=Thalassospira TaxID=168934 RepID=UPI000C9C1D2F|nr:amino acid ABC transporter permease [Thalassospira sp. GB04J01]|tara:strand:- start:576 stop:1235 length:660 start_codon:yes stop_codon:yes gene_type:complete